MSEGFQELTRVIELEEDIETVLSRYESQAFSLYELIVPGAERAGEALATAFSDAIRRFSDGSSSVSLEVSLYREVIREAINTLNELGIALSEEAGWQPAVLPSVSNRFSGCVADSAIHQLPIEYRIVFSLRDALRLPMSLVQEVLSVTELEVKAYLHRARLMLFRIMRDARG